MREEVGADNFFLFGLTAQQVAERKARGYEPSVHYQQDAELRGVIDAIAEGVFSPREPALFQPLVNDLMGRDEYLLLADFRAYVDAQRRVDEAWLNPEAWNRMCILNIARMGKFSSDRAVTEYAEGIWGAKPIHVPTT
jgi:starch phosphorylase